MASPAAPRQPCRDISSGTYTSIRKKTLEWCRFFSIYSTRQDGEVEVDSIGPSVARVGDIDRDVAKPMREIGFPFELTETHV
jgi:hypothetical protein